MKKTTHIRVYSTTKAKIVRLAELLGDSEIGTVARIVDELTLRLPQRKPKGQFILTELFGSTKGEK